MTGRTHRRFWKRFEALPPAVQKLPREKYALWKRDPYHPSLQFEERRNGICVVRIGVTTVQLEYAKATLSPGFGSVLTRNTTVFVSETASLRPLISDIPGT